MKIPRAISILAVFSVSLAASTCKRELRDFSHSPEASQLSGTSEINNPYEGNAWAVAEGKRLYNWYNCSGCHGNGGGGSGPPLMDAKWIYGGDSDNIVETILKGRPNGMPSFHGKIPDYQVWQIAAYVKSMSGRIGIDVAPGRGDSIAVGTPEAMRDAEPVRSVEAEHP